MRFNEFKLTEEQQKNLLKEKYPHLSEEQLDEILPAIGAIAGGLARGVAAVGGAAARGIGAAARGVAKGAGAAAKGVGKAAVRTAANTKQKFMGDEPDDNTTSNSTVSTNKPLTPAQKQAQLKQKLQKGKKISLPTANNKEQEFEVGNVKGQEIEIKNPKPRPGEPTRTVYNRKDLEKFIK
jgi:hypothetical protein